MLFLSVSPKCSVSQSIFSFLNFSDRMNVFSNLAAKEAAGQGTSDREIQVGVEFLKSKSGARFWELDLDEGRAGVWLSLSER